MLIAMVVMDAVYSMMITIVQRAPSIGAGVLAGWIAHRNGASSAEVIGIALVSAVLMCHLIQKCGEIAAAQVRYERPTLPIVLRVPD